MISISASVQDGGLGSEFFRGEGRFELSAGEGVVAEHFVTPDGRRGCHFHYAADARPDGGGAESAGVDLPSKIRLVVSNDEIAPLGALLGNTSVVGNPAVAA